MNDEGIRIIKPRVPETASGDPQTPAAIVAGVGIYRCQQPTYTVGDSSDRHMPDTFNLDLARERPPRSIFTWDDLVSKFINQFFPPSKTTSLRNEITNFRQRFDGSFSEAWDRIKDLLRACPHHGFSELHHLDTFYNALNSKDQDSLNSSVGGNFLDKMPRDCLSIIESKSKVRYSRDKPVVAKVSMNAFTSGVSPDVAELKDMVKALLLDKKGQNQSPALVKAVEESCYRPQMMSNQIRPPGFPPVPNNQNVQRNNQNHFIPNQNWGNNFNQGPVYQPPVFQQPAYQAPAYQALAPQTQGVLKEDFLAYVKANDAVMKNMQTQGQNMQNQLNNLTVLITKFLNSNSASTSSSGTLSSNTIANPKSDLKAITTRSGVSYDGPQIPPPVVENKPKATKDTVNPTNNGKTEDVQPQTVQSKSPVSTFEPATDLVSASKPNPKASIPYPSRRNDERNCEKANNQIKKFYQIFKDMSFEISFADAVILMPKFASTLKALIGNKEKLSEMTRTPLNEHCSVVLLKKLTEKLGDPGKFLIPCDFPGMAECLALADLGASINLMPFSVWKRLSLPDLTPTYMNLELANCSISHPVRVAEDVYVKKSFNRCIRSDMTAKRIDVIDMACEEYSQKVLCFFDTIASGSPTPYDDPIVFATSPTLTPFENSDFLLEVVDAFLAIEDEPTSSEFHQSYLDPEGDILLLEAFLNDDPSSPPLNQRNYLPEVRKEHKIFEPKNDKSSVDEPPNLSVEEKTALLTVLKSHKRAIAWKLFDIKGINPEFCTHKIFMEEDFTPTVQHQRRVNPKIHDVIKQEVIKLLDAGLIYPISHSPWVSMVHCVPKKGGFPVVENEDNELIPTRLVTEKMLKRCKDTNLCLNWEKSHFMVKEEKDTPFIFSQECVDAFQTLKKKLTEAPILIAPDWDMPFDLMCDASDFAIGAVLGQRQDKHFKLIHYASKTMTKAESNYTTTEKEMLAVVYAFEKFQSYPILNKSILYTDHSALKYLFAKKDSKARLL
nr:reverse transcriptase domain-containing protein [Tanacetum cinerariifolium]